MVFRIERPDINIYDLVETTIQPEDSGRGEVTNIPEGEVLAELETGIAPRRFQQNFPDIPVDEIKPAVSTKRMEEVHRRETVRAEILSEMPQHDWVDLETGDAVLRGRATKLSPQRAARARALVALSIADDLQKEREEVLRDTMLSVQPSTSDGLQAVPQVPAAESYINPTPQAEGQSFEEMP